MTFMHCGIYFVIRVGRLRLKKKNHRITKFSSTHRGINSRDLVLIHRGKNEEKYNQDEI